MVIIKRETGDSTIKFGLVVISILLRTKIVNPIMVFMFLVQEFFDSFVVIPVDTLHLLGRVAHGDDFVVDVGEVQVELALFVSAFFLTDDGFDGG